jgi:hypothetical protein
VSKEKMTVLAVKKRSSDGWIELIDLEHNNHHAVAAFPTKEDTIRYLKDLIFIVEQEDKYL